MSSYACRNTKSTKFYISGVASHDIAGCIKQISIATTTIAAALPCIFTFWRYRSAVARKKISFQSASLPHYPPKHLVPAVKDPWDMEHKESLETRGPTACTDLTYPFVKHAGFDAEYTAKSLWRRYSAFQETEQHRRLLVRSLSERLQVPGEKYDYFTPEQLWGEDDRLRGVRQFTKDDEVSWDEENSLSEEDIAALRSHPCTMVSRLELGGGELELPITLQTDDYETTVTQNQQEIDQVLATLDLSQKHQVTAIANTFVNGTLAVALLGQAKTTDLVGSRENSGLASEATDIAPTTITEQQPPTKQISAGEWNLLIKRPGHPNVTFLLGAKTWMALLSAIRWDNDGVLAVIQQGINGQVVVILVGYQTIARPWSFVRGAPADHSLMLETFLDTNVISYLREISPKTHLDLLTLLQSAQQDLAAAGLIDASIADDASVSSSSATGSEKALHSQKRDPNVHVAELPDTHDTNMAGIAQRGRETTNAAALPKPSVSCSRTRMLQILQHPKFGVHNSLQPVSTRMQCEGKGNFVSDEDELQLLTPPPTNTRKGKQALQATPTTSGFPDAFGSSLGKRSRQIQTPATQDGNEDSSKPSPSKPRKKQKQTHRPVLDRDRTPPTLASSNVKNKKKVARKPLTAAESRKSIADIKAQLKLFREARRLSRMSESGANGVVSSPADNAAVNLTQGVDEDMEHEQLPFIPEESEEESEEL